jgi:hypothetical protein
LSVLLLFTDSDYLFGIFRLFLLLMLAVYHQLLLIVIKFKH